MWNGKADSFLDIAVQVISGYHQAKHSGARGGSLKPFANILTLRSNARRVSNARMCVRNAACALGEALAVSDT